MPHGRIKDQLREVEELKRKLSTIIYLFMASTPIEELILIYALGLTW